MSNTGTGGALYIGPYKVVDELGVGGFATVYKAVVEGDLGFEREVALKVLHGHITRNKPEVVRMLADEAMLLARMKHPNIVGVQWFGQLDHPNEGRAFAMLMEYVDGRSLRSLLEEMRHAGQLLPLSVLVDAHVDIARGLAYAHALKGDDGQRLGLVHRDLKPDNVMISAHGQVKLLDFGIAKAKDRLAEQTATDQVRGTVHYMSPEQVRGSKDLDYRSDLFSFGAMLFEAAAGERMIGGDSVISALHSVAMFDPAESLGRIQQLHPTLAPVLEKCLAVEREDRWGSTEELVAALESLRRTIQTDEATAAFLGQRASRPRPGGEGPVSGTEDTVAVESVGSSRAPFTRTEAVPTPAAVTSPPGPTRQVAAPSSQAPLWLLLAVLLGAGGIGLGLFLGQRGGEGPVAAATTPGGPTPLGEPPPEPAPQGTPATAEATPTPTPAASGPAPTATPAAIATARPRATPRKPEPTAPAAATPARAATPAPAPAGPPGRLRVTADHPFEITIAGTRYTQLEARRGIALPPGATPVVLECLQCPDGVNPRLRATVAIPAGDTLVQRLKFAEEP